MAPAFLKSEYDDRLARVRTEMTARGLDTIVIGPGGMAQMHKPDEFITEEAIDEGLQFLERLLDEMSGCNA